MSLDPETFGGAGAFAGQITRNAELIFSWGVGGPDRVRTDDLFHAMEARSQLRHRPIAFILRHENTTPVVPGRKTIGYPKISVNLQLFLLTPS